MSDPFSDVNPAQADLRERVEAAVTAACQEWGLSYYDVSGVLHTYLLELHSKISTEESES